MPIVTREDPLARVVDSCEYLEETSIVFSYEVITL